MTLLAQCMEQRARLVRRRMDARVRCAGELLARVMEVRATADRVERALEDTGLLTPALRACGIDDASPGEKTHPSSQHVHACATYDEEVRAINEGRRRPSALPAPLGITPPVTASDPNNKRARRDDDDDDETERRRKQRREFSFDLVTPTLSTTPDEGDEEEDEKECDETSQPEPMPTSEDPEDPDDTAAVSHKDNEEATTIKETQDELLVSDEDVERGDDEDRELEGEVLATTDCQKLLPADSDGEDSGYSAEGELSLSVTASPLGVREAARGWHAVAVTNHEVTPIVTPISTASPLTNLHAERHRVKPREDVVPATGQSVQSLSKSLDRHP